MAVKKKIKPKTTLRKKPSGKTSYVSKKKSTVQGMPTDNDMNKGANKNALVADKARYPLPPKFVQDKRIGEIANFLDPDKHENLLGVRDNDLRGNLITQIIYSSRASNDYINASLAALTELEPKNPIEALLMTQIVAVHNMAMEASRRSMSTGQTGERVDREINNAAKLMRTFTAQIEALNRLRNKGKQQITVQHQHVNVNDGGQAVIGDIKQKGGGVDG